MGEAKRKRDVAKPKVNTFSGASINKACLCSTMKCACTNKEEK